MTRVLHGIRVVEVAMWGFVPAAGAVLADWGADVIKVEHPVFGDPMRGLASDGLDGGGTGVSPMWEIFNRGKRSIGIDIAVQEGREVLMDLVATADVFLTSFLPPARQKLGIEPDDLRARNPRIIYARGSGQGPLGPEADKGGFDAISYWFRSGAASGVTPAELEWPLRMPGPAFGDIQGGMMLAGGVGTALGHRDRTGEPTVVDISLLATGMWAMAPAIVGTQLTGAAELPKRTRSDPNNALANIYRTADGRYIALSILQSDRYWAGFCTALGHPELIDDARFADRAARAAHPEETLQVLDEIFGARPLAEWCERLAGQEGQWDVVNTAGDVARDRQAIANGYVQPVVHPSGAEFSLVSSPIQFDADPPALSAAPELGASTEELLLATGRDWEQIIALKELGAVN
ncbi:CaiB/BaiF CoA transferase family protein [Pseudonocardia sp. GCM10023141]|uniref:CaiB/BaiF CoA transferase family protein n=1 Tax=Pseudonocardia sp. GCM10023141 TaxID=3252653 RepID=UPI003620CE0A